jgi:hypothetical protein
MLRRLLVGFALVAGLAGVGPGPAAAAERPLYYARALAPADLEGRTLRELSLMRNTIYARAGHTFRKPWLRSYFTAQSWYQALPRDDDSKLTEVDHANAKLITQAEEAQTRPDLLARRDAVLARQRAGTAAPEDDIELTLLNTRLGARASAEAEAAPPSDVSPLEDPSQLDRLLTLKQLDGLSRRDLRILRNTVYARHGRAFKSQLLQQYFGNMSWYQVDPAFTEKRLTKIDTTNIRLIKSVEGSLGGPLTEDEDLRWMSMA